MTGDPGVVLGIMMLDGIDGGPSPSAFVAVTVNVYAVPFDRPVTIIGLVAPVAVKPPGLEVRVYDVTPPPPVVGAVKLIVACVLPGTAIAAVGAPGSIGTGITLLEANDGRLVPTSFVAATVKE